MKVASGADDPYRQVMCIFRGWHASFKIGLWACEHSKLTVWFYTFLIVRLAFPQSVHFLFGNESRRDSWNSRSCQESWGVTWCNKHSGLCYGWMTESTCYFLIAQVRQRLKCEKSLLSLRPVWWMQLSRTVWWCYSMNLSDRCRTHGDSRGYNFWW